MPSADVFPHVVLSHVEVHLSCGDDSITHILKATPQEAFSMMTMPALAGAVVMLVPCYELPEMSEKEG